MPATAWAPPGTAGQGVPTPAGEWPPELDLGADPASGPTTPDSAAAPPVPGLTPPPVPALPPAAFPAPPMPVPDVPAVPVSAVPVSAVPVSAVPVSAVPSRGWTRVVHRRPVLAAIGTALVVAAAALVVAVPRLLADPPAGPGPTGAASPADAIGLPPPLEPSSVVTSGAAGPNGVAPSSTASGSRPAGSSGAGAPGYGTPVASDTFTGTTLSADTWGRYESTAANGSVWRPDMVKLSGGELQIVGTGRNASGAGNSSGGACWGCHGAGRTYGVWQLRARFDAGAGYGPVIGLAPANATMDAAGWITLLRVSKPARTSATHLVRGPANKSEVTGSSNADLTAWHTYTVEWRATVVRMYRDDTLLMDTTGRTVTIPSVPMFLFMQQEVGPTANVPAPDATTPNQVTMHVDWVRYYA